MPRPLTSRVHGQYNAGRHAKIRWRGLRFERLEPRALLSVVPGGAEFRLNTYTTSNQRSASVATDNEGDFVVVWESDVPDANFRGIYAQRFDAAGVAQGAAFRVNTFTTGTQHDPSVAMDADGDFVVVWDSLKFDGNGYSIYAQRYDATGAAQGGQFRVNTSTVNDQRAPSVAMDADGDFVVVWNGSTLGDGRGVYAQRYNAAGVAQGVEFRVNTYTTIDQRAASIAMDADGDFVVAWQSYFQDGSAYGIYAQRYSATGVAQGAEFRVNSYTTGHQLNPSIAMDQDGNFVVVWDGTGAGDAQGIFAQRYDSAGAVQGSEFRVSTTPFIQRASSVAADAAGDFLVAWISYNQDGSDEGVFAQRYNAAGVAQGAEFRVNTYTTNSQADPSVAMDADGDFVIAWQSYGQDGSSRGVYAQRYDAGDFGDFDDDLDRDAADIDILWQIVRGTGTDPNGDDTADLNGDGLLNEDDVDWMVTQIVGPNQGTIYGDADLDGSVGGLDYTAWRNRDGTGWAHGDFDGDGGVGGLDYTLWRTRPANYPGTVGTHGAAGSTNIAASAPLAASANSAASETTPQAQSRPCAVATKTEPPTSLIIKRAIDSALSTSTMYRSRHLARGNASLAAGPCDQLLALRRR